MNDEDQTLWAFIADGEDGGLVAAGMNTPQGAFFGTLTTLNPKLLETMRPIAQDIAHESGRTVRLFKFTNAEELEVFLAARGPVQ